MSLTSAEAATRAKAPNFIAQCLSGFENPLPRTKVRGYTRTSVFLQPVKSGAGTAGAKERV